MPSRNVTGTVTFSDGARAKVDLVVDITVEVRRPNFTFVAGTIVQADPDAESPHRLTGKKICLTNGVVYTDPINATFRPDEPSP